MSSPRSVDGEGEYGEEVEEVGEEEQRLDFVGLQTEVILISSVSFQVDLFTCILPVV